MPETQPSPARPRKLGLWILLGVLAVVALGWIALHLLGRARQNTNDWIRGEWEKTVNSATTQPSRTP